VAERAPDPVAVALAFAIREAKRRQLTEQAERRAKITLVDGGKRKGAAA
jgi:hypothetical protein